MGAFSPKLALSFYLAHHTVRDHGSFSKRIKGSIRNRQGSLDEQSVSSAGSNINQTESGNY
jgi:hypothetical protein